MSTLFGSIFLRHGCSIGKKMLTPMMIRPFTSSFTLHYQDTSNDSSNAIPKSQISLPKYTIANHPFSITGAPLRENSNTTDTFAVFEFSGTQYKATVVYVFNILYIKISLL